MNWLLNLSPIWIILLEDPHQVGGSIANIPHIFFEIHRRIYVRICMHIYTYIYIYTYVYSNSAIVGIHHTITTFARRFKVGSRFIRIFVSIPPFRCFPRSDHFHLVYQPNLKRALIFKSAAPHGWPSFLGIILKLEACRLRIYMLPPLQYNFIILYFLADF